MAEKPENKTEDRKEDEKKYARSEWLLLLLSLIILILLLLLFLMVGISYYKLERSDVFKIRGNVVYLYPGGEGTEDLEKIIEDIEDLPSREEIERLTDPKDIFDLIDRIYEILLRAESLTDEEKEFFDSTYRDMLDDPLDALKERALEEIERLTDLKEIVDLIDRINEIRSNVEKLPDKKKESFDSTYGGTLDDLEYALKERLRQIGAEIPYEHDGVIPSYGPLATGEDRQGVPGETGSKKAESKSSGGSGSGSGGRKEPIPDGPIQFTIWDEDGNYYTQDKDGTIKEPISFDTFSEILYPGDRITKRYKAKIVYTGNKKLHIDFKKQTGSLDADTVAAIPDCTVMAGSSWTGPYDTPVYIAGDKLKDMGAVYELPPTTSETEIEKYFEITISVPTTVEYSYSQAGSLQGKDTGNFIMRWSIN